MLRNGVNTAVVAQLFGHESVETTAIMYGHLQDDDRFQIHDTKGPLANLGPWLVEQQAQHVDEKSTGQE
jgi:hypothetical protein